MITLKLSGKMHEIKIDDISLNKVRAYIQECYYNDRNNAVFESYNYFHRFDNLEPLKDSKENLQIILDDTEFLDELRNDESTRKLINETIDEDFERSYGSLDDN